VTARNSSFSYKGQSPDIRQVASELGVRYVLEGSVRKAGNRVRITAQLIDGASGNHVWAERYDREIEDIFAVQDEITRTVVGAIEPELSRAEQERAHQKPPENMDAWDFYQRGLGLVWRFNKSDSTEARSFFQRAVESFSPAFAGFAYGYIQEFTLDLSSHKNKPLAKAAIAARKALTLDNRNGFASWALGGVHLFFRDFDTAITELRKSLNLNPSFAPTHLWIGTALLANGQAREAEASMELAYRLCPRDPMLDLMLVVRAFAHLTIGEYEEAETRGKKSINASNGRQAAYAVHASALGHQNRGNEARATMDTLRRLNPEPFIERLTRAMPFFANEVLRSKFIEGSHKAGIVE